MQLILLFSTKLSDSKNFLEHLFLHLQFTRLSVIFFGLGMKKRREARHERCLVRTNLHSSQIAYCYVGQNIEVFNFLTNNEFFQNFEKDAAAIFKPDGRWMQNINVSSHGLSQHELYTPVTQPSPRQKLMQSQGRTQTKHVLKVN